MRTWLGPLLLVAFRLVSPLSLHPTMRRSITFVTGNKKKLEEVVAVLGTSLPYELKSAKLGTAFTVG